MKFSDIDKQTQTDLLRALDKRFPMEADRRDLLERANITWPNKLPNTWSNIFYCIGDRPRLISALLSTAIQLRPTDDTLRAISELMCPSQQFRLLTLHGVSMILGAACAFLLFWETEYTLDDVSPPPAQMTKSLDRSGPSAQPQESPPPPILEQEPSSQMQLESSSDTTTSSSPAPASSTPPTSKKKQGYTRCRPSGDGELIGYWYAGEQSLESKDGWLEMDVWRNVRADYPDKHNNYNARATINCTLSPKTKVFLKDPPILVPGGKYWVPIYGTIQG